MKFQSKYAHFHFRVEVFLKWWEGTGILIPRVTTRLHDLLSQRRNDIPSVMRLSPERPFLLNVYIQCDPVITRCIYSKILTGHRIARLYGWVMEYPSCFQSWSYILIPWLLYVINNRYIAPCYNEIRLYLSVILVSIFITNGSSILRHIFLFTLYILLTSFVVCWSSCLNTLRPSKMDAISQTTFSSAFSCMKMFEFRFEFHLSLFLRVQWTIFQHWFR